MNETYIVNNSTNNVFSQTLDNMSANLNMGQMMTLTMAPIISQVFS